MRVYKLTMDDLSGHGAYLVGLFLDEPSGAELLFAMQHPLDTAPAPLSILEFEKITESILSSCYGSVGSWCYLLDMVKI